MSELVLQSEDLLCLVSSGVMFVDIDSNKGRLGRIAREVGEGVLLCSSFPYVSCISFDHVHNHCNQCFIPYYRLKSKLQRCSGCKRAKYCSRQCQKAAWNIHKAECAFWKEDDLWNNLELLDTDGSSTILLTIRVLEKKKIQEKTESLDYQDDWQRIENFCGFRQEKSTENFDSTSVTLLAEIINRIYSNTIDTTWCADLLMKMQKNNFQIVDELFQRLGGAVYPVGALLNHSCEPNSILMYRYDKEVQVFVQEIRTLRPLAKGEEITHAYTDGALVTMERKKRLYQQYEFDCTCNKCGEDWSPTDLILRGYKDNSNIDHIKQADKLFEKGIGSDEVVERAVLFQDCLSIRLVELHPYSLPVFMTRCKLFDCYMEIPGQEYEAMKLCESICEGYEESGMYGKKNDAGRVIHPMIGLQYFTLGDLLLDLCQLQREKGQLVARDFLHKTRTAYQRSYDILKITHGTKHSLTKTLKQHLSN